MLVLATACGGNDGASGDASPAGVATEASASSTPAVTATPPGMTVEATAAPEPLYDGEPVSFRTPDGTTVDAQLLSVPGPNQRVVIFTAPDVARYQEIYGGLVERGRSVLVFSAGEDAGPAIETAVQLLRSREYPLIYLVTADAAGANATSIAAGLGIEALIVSDHLSRRVEYFAGGTELEETATLSAPSLEVPEQLRETILRYVEE